ncbi:creatininase family protein [Sphingomonas sp. BK235]|uniref:creatininase family protein n=1 Tax=Sphingomonas sp. BK235 TaxID=2512131 RepID=UPI0010429042|nr:creatininase family protein [Sphingomonas sp. BK235]TCP30349.1 creatinine amidohydrolase [Sphingomonas sp. BK235]
MTKRAHALQDLTWSEFAGRLPERPVIVLPLGSQEEQGPHAPMGDFVVAERIAHAAAARADAICAPVLPFGYAEFFRGMPGGVQLRGETFRFVLRDMIDAFTDHDIEHVVVVNGHSTNAPLILEVTHEVRRKTGLVIPNLNLWRMLPEATWRQVHGDHAAAARGHGADPLTSLMLHLTPELVRGDLIEPASRRLAFGLPTQSQFSGVEFHGMPIDMPLDVTDVASNGVGSGNAALASATAGATIAEETITRVADFLQHWRRQDPRQPDRSA